MHSFTDVTIDCKEVWNKYPVTTIVEIQDDGSGENCFEIVYRFKWLPYKIRLVVWLILSKAHIDTSWLEILNKYWTSILGGRPITGVLDFAFFHGVYREKFMKLSQVVQLQNDGGHLQAYQKTELIFQMISLVYRESIQSQAHLISLVKQCQAPKGAILEFGAAIAPLASFVTKFSLTKRQIYIADLPTVSFHFACYRFRRNNKIVPLTLYPENSFSLPDDIDYSIIFCREVLEHLPDPLNTVKFFYNHLPKDGLFVFDYILSDAEGFDTHAAVKYRLDVVKFIESNFEIVVGDLSNPIKTIGLIIARKK